MKIHLLSYHASAKIRERRIRFKDIPDISKLTNGIHKVSKRVRGRDLVAFYEVRPDSVMLMTAYWREK